MARLSKEEKEALKAEKAQDKINAQAAKAQEKADKAREKQLIKEEKIQLKKDQKEFKQSLKTMPRKERKAAKKAHKEEILERKDHLNKRTYAPNQIRAELRRVQWPSFGELMKSSGLVIIFTVLFGVYFFLCELLANGMIQAIVGVK